MDAVQGDNGRKHIRLQETIAVAVNSLDSRIVGDGDMARSNADHFAIFLMSVMNRLEATASSSFQKKPEVGEGRQTGGGDVSESPFLNVGENIVGGDQGKKKIRRENISDHVDWKYK